MAAGDERARAAMERARQRARMERLRAVQDAEFAARHEALSESDLPPLQTDFHRSMAALHRHREERHRVAFRIHQDYAQRLESWVRDKAGTDRPGLIAAVANAAGSHSATLVLLGRGNAEALVATSDATSAAAHELELTFAEGPSRDAMKGRVPIWAAGSGLSARWPHYGPALRELGVAAVSAIGLRTAKVSLGTLIVYDPPADSPGSSPSELPGIASAVVHSMLLDTDALGTERLPALTHFGKDGFQAVLHQAAGKIHAECGCGVENALSLIRAYAFAEDLPAATVAQDVVRGVLRLP